MNFPISEVLSLLLMLSLSFERNWQKGVGAAEQPSGGSNRTIRRFGGSKARRPSSSQTQSAAGSSTATFPMNIDSTSAIPVSMNYGNNTSSPAGYPGYVSGPSTVDEERVRQIVRAQLSQHSDQMGREFDTLIASSSINENTSPEELCAQNPDAYRAMVDRLTANFQTNLQLSQTAPHSTTFTGASTTSSFSMGSNSGHAGHGRSETRGNNRSYGSGRNTRPPGGGFKFD